LSDSDRKGWPEVERRTSTRRARTEPPSRDRRSGLDRRNEAGWQPIPVDESDRSDEELVALARQAREYAHAQYSGFKVGAALELADGTVSTGCNIENATYGLTLCAERVALVKALSEGHTSFSRIAVVADTAEPTPPCGSCRQLLWEYCGDIAVILGNLEGPRSRYSLKALLPLAFDMRLLKSGEE
jgi:cytidine deaminase